MLTIGVQVNATSPSIYSTDVWFFHRW